MATMLLTPSVPLSKSDLQVHVRSNKILCQQRVAVIRVVEMIGQAYSHLVLSFPNRTVLPHLPFATLGPLNTYRIIDAISGTRQIEMPRSWTRIGLPIVFQSSGVSIRGHVFAKTATPSVHTSTARYARPLRSTLNCTPHLRTNVFIPGKCFSVKETRGLEDLEIGPA